MPHSLHPGPIDASLLTLQQSHRSEDLWEGRIHSTQLVIPQKVESAWDIFYNPYPTTVSYIIEGGVI
ncbi:hypothetical protein P3S67_024111 [Capsicum chacoense]